MKLNLKLPRRNPDAPRPSLRERAAALKASAAKVIGKGPAQYTPPQPIGAGKPSAALAVLLDAHQLAYGHALCSDAYRLPDAAERLQAEEEAFRTLLHTPLHSDADRAAYAAAVISRQMNALGDDSATERDHPMAVAFRNISFGEHAREREEMRHIGRRAEPEPAADPVLTAIEAHRAAHAVWHPLMCAWSDTLGGTPEYETAEATDAAARPIERAAFRALLATRPTTTAGCVAFTAYLSGMIVETDHHLDEDMAEVMRALRDGAAPFAAEPATTAQPAPDLQARARISAEQIDLTKLDVFQLSGLFEAYQVAKFSWEGVAERPYAYEVGLHGAHHPTELAEVAEFEERRAAWIMDRLEREIVSRKPEDAIERDTILMTRIQQELRCNSRIHDNALLLDITRAWIV